MVLFLEVLAVVFKLSLSVVTVMSFSTLIGVQFNKEMNHVPLTSCALFSLFVGIIYLLVWSVF